MKKILLFFLVLNSFCAYMSEKIYYQTWFDNGITYNVDGLHRIVFNRNNFTDVPDLQATFNYVKEWKRDVEEELHNSRRFVLIAASLRCQRSGEMNIDLLAEPYYSRSDRLKRLAGADKSLNMQDKSIEEIQDFVETHGEDVFHYPDRFDDSGFASMCTTILQERLGIARKE